MTQYRTAVTTTREARPPAMRSQSQPNAPEDCLATPTNVNVRLSARSWSPRLDDRDKLDTRLPLTIVESPRRARSQSDPRVTFLQSDEQMEEPFSSPECSPTESVCIPGESPSGTFLTSPEFSASESARSLPSKTQIINLQVEELVTRTIRSESEPYGGAEDLPYGVHVPPPFASLIPSQSPTLSDRLSPAPEVGASGMSGHLSRRMQNERSRASPTGSRDIVTASGSHRLKVASPQMPSTNPDAASAISIASSRGQPPMPRSPLGSGSSAQSGSSSMRLQSKVVPPPPPQATLLLESARCEVVTMKSNPPMKVATPRTKVYRSQSQPDPPSSVQSARQAQRNMGTPGQVVTPCRVAKAKVVSPNPWTRQGPTFH